MKWNELKKSKTFWSGLVTIIATTGAYFTEQISLVPAIQTISAAFFAIFIRDAIAKK